MIITNSRYALVGYFITSYPTRAHGIIVNYNDRLNVPLDLFVSLNSQYCSKCFAEIYRTQYENARNVGVLPSKGVKIHWTIDALRC